MCIRDSSFIEPLNKSVKTANNVKKVSRDTRNFEILSRALYLPIINIIPETIRIPIDKSIAGKTEKNGILVNRTPETKLTAAIVKVPVIRLTTRNKGRYKEFLSLKPSNNDLPVDAVNLVPTNKNGYFKRLVRRIGPTNENPNLAPAVVDDNKWEPPIAAPARTIPGPKLFCIPFVKFIF